MDIELRAVQRTVPHVAAAIAAIGRTRLHIRLVLIPIQDTSVVLFGVVAEAQVQAAAGRVGRHRDRL